MRRVFLSASFLLLVVCLVALWRVRFERMPDTPSLTLADLRNASPVLPSGAVWQGSKERPALRLVVGAAVRQVGLRMELPGFSAVEALQIRFNMVARNLKLGKQEWDDGRLLIEWRSPDGVAKQEADPVASLRDNEASGDIQVVARPSSCWAVPVLRVEHLGRGGELEISKLEIIPVREREIWKAGRWVLLAAWMVWIWLFLAGADQRSPWRNLLAAGVWLAMGVFFAVPGPWKTLRPLLFQFEIGMPAPPVAAVGKPVGDSGFIHAPRSMPSRPPSSEVLGRIPLQGGWILQVKHHLAKMRPVLHGLLLFAPALAFAFLVGRRSAVALAVGLGLSIEAAQTAFGYGFDVFDVFDLACDAVGIALAIRAHDHLKARGYLTRVFSGS